MSERVGLEPPTLSTTGRGRLRAPEGGWATGAQVEVATVVSRRLTGEDVVPLPESSMHLPGVGFSRSSVRLLVLTSFYLLFLVLGASIFSAIEGPQEVQLIRQLRHMRLQFLKRHQCVPGE
uniref:Uncharacterized protein n=1 Tax=Timema bartmani TaxID=61472 RepID=A0A7R9F3I9_9NEOP|nr:unnamed protein product [Timema bartmani]